MIRCGSILFGCLFGGVVISTTQAADHFVSPTGAHQAPFATWADAATNIQDAIDAAAAGDVVWVTNGIYATGGKVMAGDLTNRIALDKAVTVQSVNGPAVTVIQGGSPPVTFGPLAVRCAWLADGALLKGFTLQGGATRFSVDITLGSGGAVWCASSNAVLANCIVRSNTAGYYGGGVYRGTLNNCALLANRTTSESGGAVYDCILTSCTIYSNSSIGIMWASGNTSRVTNCIAYYNANNNYGGPSALFSYCCTVPLPSGPGNISDEPKLLADAIHLAKTSPCRGKGTNLVSGTDLDGQSWINPPSMGADEWQPPPIILTRPATQLTNDPVGFSIRVAVAGEEPFTCWWTRDGTPLENNGHYNAAHTTNLVVSGVSQQDEGSYQVVVSNAFGMATSEITTVTFHYVDVAAPSPAPPYSTWATAATNIQDAIDAVRPGEIILVTNGVYASGGKTMDGDLTNRVTLDKALLVQSVNGSAVTVVQGAWDPATTNGPGAVRCAWLTNGAILSGFTLRGGATRAQFGNGGGAWGSSSNSATVANCLIVSNTANYAGGAYRVLLQNCTLSGNRVPNGNAGGAGTCSLRNCVLSENVASGGGGAFQCNLKNCAITGNSASSGGGVYLCSLVNCTVSGNTAGNASSSSGYGGGAHSASLTNCIVFANTVLNLSNPNLSNYDACQFSSCCTAPLPAGIGNINVDPLLLADAVHLAGNSPCRGAGTNSVIFGSDLDGQPWANPPSIGCDEWQPEPALFVQPTIQFTNSPFGFRIAVVVAGQGPLICWWTRNGAPLENDGHYYSAHTTALGAKGILPQDIGWYQVVVSNALGSVSSAVVQLQMTFHFVDAAGINPVPPYASWANAATNIQDAIDIALPGEIVLVTNGLYASGGRVMAGDLTNRVALTKALMVSSVNGPGSTIIRGAWDFPNGLGSTAIRCAWLTNGATLNGFTLERGATRTNGDVLLLGTGGGAWATSTAANICNCVLSNNVASFGGGGCYKGVLNQCLVVGNLSYFQGGGCYESTVRNCAIIDNHASWGGGTYFGSVYNSTLVANFANTGGGMYDTLARNSIVFYNNAFLNGPFGPTSEWYSYTPNISFTCTAPLPSGNGNKNTVPELLDRIHLKLNSPCRGAGSAAYASGADFDGESWTNPPSMGCDEIWEAALNGQLSVTVTSPWPAIAEERPLSLMGFVSGRASRLTWQFGDGSVETNASSWTSHAWANPGDYMVTFSAFNNDYPSGVSTNLIAHVLALQSPALSAGLSGTNFSLTFTGQPGVSYVVEQTTNLAPPVAWQNPSYLNANAGGLMQFSIPATNATRFFRVRTL